jgi:hypothetical protein
LFTLSESLSSLARATKLQSPSRTFNIYVRKHENKSVGVCVHVQ